MFAKLEEINRKPELFKVYTAEALWADPYRSKQMLKFHLNENIDLSSRNIEFINRSSSWMIDRFDLGPGRSVCDFGCGPGLYTSRFAQSGAHVTGLDFSENSIRYARGKAASANQTITYVQADYLDFDQTDHFDLITMIMCDFCALNPLQRNKVLKKIHASLKQGGSVLLDVYSKIAYAERGEASFYEKNHMDHFWCEEDYYCFVNTFKYESEHVVLDKYNLMKENGESEEIFNWLKYFCVEELSSEMRDAGFSVKDIFQDVSGTPFSENAHEFAVVAQHA